LPLLKELKLEERLNQLIIYNFNFFFVLGLVLSVFPIAPSQQARCYSKRLWPSLGVI